MYRYESATIARVVLALGAIGFVCVALIGFLAWSKAPIPDALASIGGGAVGALATLLVTFAPSPVPGGRRAVDVPASPTVTMSTPPEVTNQ